MDRDVRGPVRVRADGRSAVADGEVVPDEDPVADGRAESGGEAVGDGDGPRRQVEVPREAEAVGEPAEGRTDEEEADREPDDLLASGSPEAREVPAGPREEDGLRGRDSVHGRRRQGRVLELVRAPEGVVVVRDGLDEAVHEGADL